MLVGGLSSTRLRAWPGRYRDDVDVQQLAPPEAPRDDARPQVSKPRLLRRLPQGDRQRILLPRIAVTAYLGPRNQPFVPPEQYAGRLAVHDERRGRQV